MTRPTVQSLSDLLWAHHLDTHEQHDEPAVIHQLLGVTFHEQALTAIRALAVTGKPFTVGQAHEMVNVAPPNPRTDWENARKEAERLGWITWTGEYTESIVPTSKHSAVKVWTGSAAARKGAA